jgi:hypothetical protein
MSGLTDMTWEMRWKMSNPVHRNRGNKNDLQTIYERRIAIRQILAKLGKDHVTDKGFVLQELAKQGFYPSKRTLERDLVEIQRKYRMRKRIRQDYKKKIDLCYRYIRKIDHTCDRIFADSKKAMTVTSVVIGPKVTKIIEETKAERVANIKTGVMEIQIQVYGMMLRMLAKAGKGYNINTYPAAFARKHVQVTQKGIKLKLLVKNIMIEKVKAENLLKKLGMKKPYERRKKKIIRLTIT